MWKDEFFRELSAFANSQAVRSISVWKMTELSLA